MNVSLKAEVTADTTPPPITVLQYFPSTSTYLLFPSTVVSTEDLKKNYDIHPSNIFYPLLDKLLSRAQEMVTGAESDPVIRGLLSCAKDIDVQKIKDSIPDLPTLISPSKLTSSTSSSSDPTIAGAVSNLTSQIDTSHANDVFHLLKQDDVKTLLEKSRDRLTTLVNTEIPEHKKQLLESTGITIEGSSSSSIMGALNDKNRRAALDALDKLLDDNQRSAISNITATVDSALESTELQVSGLVESAAVPSLPLVVVIVGYYYSRLF